MIDSNSGAIVILLLLWAALLALAITEVVVFVVLMAKSSQRPHARGRLLLVACFAASLGVGVMAFLQVSSNSPFDAVVIAVGTATFVMLLVLVRARTSRVVLLYSVGVVLELGLFVGFAALPRLPGTGPVLSQIRCDADVHCSASSLAVDGSAHLAVHLAGNDGWLVEAVGDGTCHVDPRPQSFLPLNIIARLPLNEGWFKLEIAAMSEPDANEPGPWFSLDMARVMPQTDPVDDPQPTDRERRDSSAGRREDLYSREQVVQLSRPGDPFAWAEGTVHIEGIEIKPPLLEPVQIRDDITGDIRWSCDLSAQ